jgi:ribonucleoside-diphosphate reductase alpha chain
MALAKLGYDADEQQAIIDYIDEQETIEGAPGLKDEHLTIFDCAFRSENGKRSIHWMGHVRMMGAAQPFLSGAISKTVNLPEDATVDDIVEAYTEGWRLGLKALAVYRDGSKRTQPLNTSKNERSNVVSLDSARPVRRKLNDERSAITHKFSIAGHEGYLTVGMYEDGQPGEIFLKMAKEGSTVSGLMDTIATMTSLSLQYGVPLKALVDKFSHTRFEPSGYTTNPEIRYAKSLMDYIFQWLGMKFPEEAGAEGEGTPKASAALEASPREEDLTKDQAAILNEAEKAIFQAQSDAPPCHSCGNTMVRSGSCYRCLNCGETSGCG